MAERAISLTSLLFLFETTKDSLLKAINVLAVALNSLTTRGFVEKHNFLIKTKKHGDVFVRPVAFVCFVCLFSSF